MAEKQILLTGSSGLIGTSVVRSLSQKRISIISMRRRQADESAPQAVVTKFWDPYSPQPVANPQELAGTTGAVHLAGVNISGRRWTRAYKREILESRVQPTRALSLLLAQLKPRPEVLVSASAVGIYGSRADETLTEASAPGSGFLPEVCLEWEKATQPASDAGIRVVHLRFGVVLSPQGGALGKMLPIFRAGLGGRLGNGRQWLSWITLPDAIRAIEFVLDTPALTGPVNAVAPNPVTNLEFTKALGEVLHRPAALPVPEFALQLAFGEMAPATILASQRVMPARLQHAGFDFDCPKLADGLQAVLHV